MNLAPMRFKDYTWPHNPEVFAVERRRRLAIHPVPFGRCVVQDLGSEETVLRGEGEFVGEGAYEEFRRLAEVFRSEGAGTLVHPVWRAERAWFAALTVEEEPLPDYVRYSFEFREDWDGYGTALTEVQAEPWSADTENVPQETDGAEAEVYVVRKGDTLWGIANRHGVTLTTLIAANPQIKNPNLIYPGDEVVIP